MKIKLTAVVYCSLLCVGCNESKKELSSFEFQQEIELKADSIHIEEIYVIKDWTVVDDMILILSSNEHPVFYLYSLPDFKFIESFGFIGRGPDEYLHPHLVRGSLGEFYLYDNGNRKFQIIRASNDGHAIEDIGLLGGKELFSQLGHIQGELFYGKVENPNYINLNVYNIDFGKIQLLSSHEIVVSKDGRSGDMDFATSNNERSIAVAYEHKKCIEFYQIDENNKFKKTKTYSDGKDIDIDQYYYTDINTYDNFTYALCQGFAHGDITGRSSIEVFDKDGNGILKIHLDIIANRLIADKTGRNFYAKTPFSDALYKYTLPELIAFAQ